MAFFLLFLFGGIALAAQASAVIGMDDQLNHQIANQQQQFNQPLNQGCLIASNFRLNFDPQKWWRCSKHVGECFDELTGKLKEVLTQGECRGHSCYSKEGVHRLKQPIHVSPSLNHRRMNGCALPQFNVGMERTANALLQKAKGCLFDVEEYEALLEHVMAGMRAERDCFLQSNPLLTQKLLQLRQPGYRNHEERYAYPREKFEAKRCLLPRIVEMTLRMRLAQYMALLRPGMLPSWQARSADAYLSSSSDFQAWRERLRKEDLRDPQVVRQAESGKKVLEDYLRALGCSTRPDPKWTA